MTSHWFHHNQMEATSSSASSRCPPVLSYYFVIQFHINNDEKCLIQLHSGQSCMAPDQLPGNTYTAASQDEMTTQQTSEEEYNNKIIRRSRYNLTCAVCDFDQIVQNMWRLPIKPAFNLHIHQALI